MNQSLNHCFSNVLFRASNVSIGQREGRSVIPVLSAHDLVYPISRHISSKVY